jgi:succinate dehydrogenase flavin-adding protein (antitoxin of CptAB toxin-antitoxin module)
VLLVRWLESRHAQASDAERAVFERLLEMPDPEIAAWFLGRSRPDDAALEALVDDILAVGR